MNERKYRQVFAQFLNDYWGAFHEVLEAQSVNPKMLAPPLFDAVVEAHRRFAAQKGVMDPAVVRLGGLWDHIRGRREATPHAPLSAREVAHARALFETIYDALVARGKVYPRVGGEVLSQAIHGNPRAPLRADAAR